jgi:hypothetical protein
MPVEHVLPGEAEAIVHMTEVLQKQLTERYKKPMMRRDAHPKHHGLVNATFIVDPARPAELRHGLFENAARFPALIRYSNGQPVVGHDLAGDIRGMAIHLERRSFIDSHAHDFILATGEAFFATDAVDYRGFPEASEHKWTMFGYFISGFRRLRCGWQLLKAFKKPTSPLVAEYFSQTPYLLGPHCVKYLVRPVYPLPSTGDYPCYLKPVVRHVLSAMTFVAGIVRPKALQRIPGFDALRKSLEIDLAERPVMLEFLVQRWPDLSTLPEWAIEDASRVWDLPWTRVATIEVHRQTDIRDRDKTAEHMNFNIWRTSAEHQPLGSINRARLAIYLVMSKFRNDFNAKKKLLGVAPSADQTVPSSSEESLVVVFGLDRDL